MSAPKNPADKIAATEDELTALKQSAPFHLTFECFPGTWMEADQVEDAICAALDAAGVKYHFRFHFRGEAAKRPTPKGE